MKKITKKFLFCTSLTFVGCSLLSSTLILTSCTPNNYYENYIKNAKTFRIEYSKLTKWLSINSIDDLISKLEQHYSKLDYSEKRDILWQICTKMRIYPRLNSKIFILNNTVKIVDNTLHFVIIDDLSPIWNDNKKIWQPSHQAIYSKVELIDINEQSSVNDLFVSVPQYNSSIFDNNLKSHVKDIYESYPKNTIVELKTILLNDKSTNYSFSSDSKYVIDACKKAYEKIYNSQTKNNQNELYKSDFDISLKNCITANVSSWDQYLYQSDLFISRTHFVEKNKIKSIVYLQIKNSTSSKQTFDFFGFKQNLKSNEYLTLKTEFIFDFNNPKLAVDKNLCVGFAFDNASIKYELSNDVQKTISKNLVLNKSDSINTQFSNVVNSQLNPYEESINKELGSKINSIKSSDMKTVVEKSLTKEFNNAKKLAIANYELINPFFYDVKKNPHYSLYDAIIKLENPIKTIYQNTDFAQYSNIISLIFSDIPIYQFVYEIFDQLISLLGSIPSFDIVYDLLYENLTINGQKKNLDQFKRFFTDIKNLKEVIKKLIAWNLDSYTISYIMLLIDSLSQPDQTLLLFISNNLSYIFKILKTVINDNTDVTNIISLLDNVKIKYKNKYVKNIITDIPLYDFLSANNITVENPIKIDSKILKLIKDLKTTIALGSLVLPDSIKPIIEFIKPILPLIQLLVNGFISCITGNSIDANYTAQNYEKYFKQKMTITLTNSNLTKNIVDYLKDEKNYKLSTFTWSKSNSNSTNFLDDELSFNLCFESAKYIQPMQKKVDIFNNNNLTFKYKFNYSTPIPIYKKTKTNAYFSWYLNSYYEPNMNQKLTSDTQKEFALNTNLENNHQIQSNQVFDKFKIDINDYRDDIIYTKHVFKFPSSIKLDNIDYKNLPVIHNNPKTKTKYFKLNNEQYNLIMNKLIIDNNLLTIKPTIQLVWNKTFIKETYKIKLIFPINIFTSNDTVTNTIEIEILP